MESEMTWERDRESVSESSETLRRIGKMSSSSPPHILEPSPAPDDILPLSSSGVKLDEPLLRRFCVAKSFRCNICDKKFSTKFELTSHSEFVHDGKKPFMCNTCDAKFWKKQALNTHVAAIHEGKKRWKKPFKCDTCNAKFTAKQSLNYHFAAVHEGKNHSNVVLVMLPLNKKVIWINTSPQFMKERNSNATLVMLALQKRLIWINTSPRFMEKENHSNVALVRLALQ